MKRHVIVGGAAIAAMTALMGYAVTDTVAAEPATPVYRAETLAQALQVCGEVSSEPEEVQVCRDAAYAVTWPDWTPVD